MRTKAIALFLVPLFISSLGSSSAQNEQPANAQAASAALPASIVERIPTAYRDEAKKLLSTTDQVQAYLAKSDDGELASWVVWNLAEKPGAAGFLLDQLEKEENPTLRKQIINSTSSYWEIRQDAEQIVERHAAGDADASVSISALDDLLSIRIRQIDKLLQTRLAVAKASGDAKALKQLAPEDERWVLLKDQVMLPGFMRVAPPLFTVKGGDKSIRVLAFGDFGTGSEAQKNTASAMLAYHKRRPFDFGLTLGDNFYTYGMASPNDPRWQTQWEELYGPLGVKFYATLGNHDWASQDSPAAEILYTDKSPDWRMPAPYYTFTAGPVQFFAFDTVEVNEAELEWLDSELSKSAARWKLVFGHYHIFSATRGDNKQLIAKLLPILEKNHVDIYLNGHDHNLQELKPEGGVHFFVSGGGGAALYDLNPYDRSIYKQKVNGFTVLEADQDHFKVSFIGTDGKELYQDTLTKKP